MLTLAVPVANGSGAAQILPYSVSTVDCYGAFDSGTVTLYESPDAGTTWIAMLDEFGDTLAFANANGSKNFHRAPGVQIRATLSGSSGSSVVVCQVRPMWAATREREF